MSKYSRDIEQWEGNSEEDDESEERKKISAEEFQRRQDELKIKITKHIQQSDASEDLTNPEFIDD